MKKLCAVLLTAVLCCALWPHAAFAAPEKPEEYDWRRFADDNITLNVYNWGMYISNGEDDSLNVTKEFEKRTGIRVNYTTYDTNESLYAKLRSGGGSYDVIIPSDYMVGKMIHEGMLEPLNFDNIPNYADVNDNYRNLAYDPDNAYSVPYMWGVVGIVYNTAMVDEGDLEQGWGILWDEKYAGQVLMFNNSRDAYAIAGKMLGNSLNPTTQKEVDAETEQLKAQKSVVQSYVMDEVFDKMIGGEAALAPYYAGDGITMMDENEDLGMFIPPEGSNLYVDAMCIPKGSKNKEAAEMFINFMCETEIGVANAEYICYSTPLNSVYDALDEETRENELMYPPQDVIDRSETMLCLPDEINSALDAAWSEVRSYDAGATGWLMPVVLLLLVVLVIFSYWRRGVRKRKREY